MQRVIFLTQVRVDATRHSEVLVLSRRQREVNVFLVQLTEHLCVLTGLVENIGTDILNAYTTTRQTTKLLKCFAKLQQENNTSTGDHTSYWISKLNTATSAWLN